MIRQFIKFLRRLELSESAINLFSMHVVYKKLPPKTLITAKGEKPTHLIYIQSGLVGLQAANDGKNSFYYTIYPMNTLVNEGPALQYIQQVVNFTTVTDCVLAYLPIQIYHEVLVAEPNFCRAMHQFTVVRGNGFRLAEFALKQGSPTFRVMVSLAHHASIVGDANYYDVDDRGDLVDILNVTHQILSEMSNVSRSVFHQTLSAFIDAGFVEHRYKEIDFSKTRHIWMKFIERVYGGGYFDQNLTVRGGIELLREISKDLRIA